MTTTPRPRKRKPGQSRWVGNIGPLSKLWPGDFLGRGDTFPVPRRQVHPLTGAMLLPMGTATVLAVQTHPQRRYLVEVG